MLKNAANKRVTIVGLGLTGLSCARYLASQAIDFRVVDSRMEPPLKAQLLQIKPNCELHCGAFDEALLSGDDLLIVSPGVALETPAIAKAIQQGATLSSDIELFVAVAQKPMIAITGSNGKSTVTTLLAEMLNAAGKQAIAAGNIGLPVLDILTEQLPADIYVLELSSFQLERLEKLGAQAAVILNLSDDHMDRYASLADYQKAKERIYQNAATIVENRAERFAKPADFQGQLLSFGLDQPEQGQFGVVKYQQRDYLAYGDQRLIACDEIKIRGSHNYQNALAALALAAAVGVEPSQVVGVLRHFAGLAHRCQWVADIEQVSFFDDSKATNVGSAVAAINGLQQVDRPLVLIAGGQDKDSDFSALATLVKQKVSAVVLIGKDADKIERALAGYPCHHANTMQQAVQQAFDLAKPNGMVLLAPACASFDMFDNYNHRGDVFSQAVRELQEAV